MADVFISFADADRRLALSLKEFVSKKVDDVSVFVSADHWQIQAGERWLDRIERELRAAKVILVVVSPLSVSSSWINFEAGAAWLNGATVIPVCCGGLTFRELPKPYDAFQAVTLDADEQVYALLRSVAAAVRPSVPPVPLIPHDPDLITLKDLAAAVIVQPSQATSTPAPPRRSFDESIVSLLSDRAKGFLIEASKTNTGEIQRIDLDQALVVKVNDKSIEARLDNGRLRAELEDALTELEENGLMSDVLGKRMLFQLTSKGYRIENKVSGAA